MQIHRNPSHGAAKRLLTECNLPTSDLDAARFESFFGCGRKDDLNGIVGVELHGQVALLRSLAVAPGVRGTGCGRALVGEAERYAWAHGVKEIYLLTTTAENFFSALGYRRIERASVPEAIQNTSEFSGLCPSSSALMVKNLGG